MKQFFEEIGTGATVTIVLIALALLFVLFLIVNPFVQVGPGERGVVMNWGQVQSQIMGEGLHMRVPFMQTVQIMSVRTQKSEWSESGADSAGTKDSQRVDVKVTVNWHIDPAKVNSLYQSVGNVDAINSTILDNNVKEALKASTAQYEALDIQKNRDVVVEKTHIALQAKVKSYGIKIDGVSLTNINFSNDFNNAVEMAQVAQQKAKQAEYDVKTAQNEAQSAIAKAEGLAKAQAFQVQSLTPELLQAKALEKWNGVLPVTMLSGSTLPFLNLK